MNGPWFHVCPIITPETTIIGPEAHHAARVLRLRPGAAVTLFDGRGQVAAGRLRAVAAAQMDVEITATGRQPRPGPPLTLAVSVPKGERLDWLVAKTTELGLDRLCLTACQRTVKQAANPRLLERLEKLALAAAKQSQRAFLPVIERPGPLADCLAQLNRQTPPPRLLLASLAAPTQPVLAALAATAADTPVAAFVGPEGGFTDDEETLLRCAGAMPVALADGVLRVETAAVALAALLAAWRNAAETAHDRS